MPHIAGRGVSGSITIMVMVVVLEPITTTILRKKKPDVKFTGLTDGEHQKRKNNEAEE